MLFNSYLFWTYFAIVYLLYRLLPHRGQNWMLLVASYIFYGWWDWRFLFLLGLTSVMDYIIGLKIGLSRTPREAKGYLLVSVIANLGLLGFFKYYGFFARELAELGQTLGMNLSLPMLNIVLPVGISFYTFQELSYTIDVYRKRIEPVRRLSDFALYVSFFPQLVAGPIERSENLIPQVLRPRTVRLADFGPGLYLVLSGLFTKIVLADNMAMIANSIFAADPNTLSGAECLMGVYAFALQVYGDFSGYSSIARGIAKWMGFDLMLNFRMPYLALSPSDFWRRWHISLSTWLRDYLYIPLGGSRGSTWKTYRNLMLTMTLGGLWHGANWTFLCWGIYHGLLLCLYRPFEKGPVDEFAPRRFGDWPINFLRGLVMFHLVCFGWVMFRAESMHQVWIFMERIALHFEMTPYAKLLFGLIAFYALPFLLFEYWLEKRKNVMGLMEVPWLARGLVYVYFVVMLQLCPPEQAHEFIYFQF